MQSSIKNNNRIMVQNLGFFCENEKYTLIHKQLNGTEFCYWTINLLQTAMQFKKIINRYLFLTIQHGLPSTCFQPIKSNEWENVLPLETHFPENAFGDCPGPKNSL